MSRPAIPVSVEGRAVLPQLIVTADDFGLAWEVNEAVELAHRNGILSAASLMVAGAAAQDAIRRAGALPHLRVGLHLTLVEAKPMLPPEQIPRLVDGRGSLRKDLARLGLELAISPSARAQMRAEIEAQFAAFHRTGLVLDHVNLHKHYHLHPVVAREVISACRHFGARALRIPFEPRPVLRLIAAEPMEPLSPAVTALTAWLRGRVRAAGLLGPDAVFGVCWSGQVTTERLSKLLQHLPCGIVEIYTHPASEDVFEGSAAGYRYRDELEALCAPEVVRQMTRIGLASIGYSDLDGTAFS